MTGTYSLVLAAIMLLIINGMGTYEYFFNMPKWFADPPASFEVIRRQTKASQKFWIPVQLLFIISYLTALISNWHITEVKSYIIYAGIAYLVIIISTATYFAKEVMAFSKIPVDAPRTDELVNRANRWYRTSLARNFLQFVVLVLILIATYKKIML